MRLQSLVKTHYLAIILAVVVGLISVAPQVYVLRDQQYSGIQIFGTDAEYFYVGRINRALYESYSGGLFPNDPGKSFYMTPKLAERFLAFVAYISHASVITVNVILKFLGPVVLFLILYGWIFEMFSSKKIALIAPLFVMMGLNLFDYQYILRFAYLRTNVDSFLTYTRPISPLISSIFLFLGLWLMYRLTNTETRFRNAVALGIVVGLSLYIYVFTWTFLSVVSALYFLHFLIIKHKQKMKYFFVVLIANAIIVLPFIVNYLKARLDPDYIYSVARNGVVHSYTPIFGIWIFLGLLLIVLLWPKKECARGKVFFMYLFVSLGIVINHQVITGITLQPGHYHWFYTKPLIAILISFLGLYWLDKIVTNKNWQRAVYVCLAILFFINGTLIQANSYSASYLKYQSYQRYASLLSFLDRNYEEEKNVWANMDLSYLVISYTRHNAPLALDNYIESEEHFSNVFFLGYRLRGISAKKFADEVQNNKDNTMNAIFGIGYRDGLKDEQVTNTELAKLISGYDAFLKIPLEQVLKNNRIDMIVEDRNNDNFHLDTMKFLKQYSIGDGLYVYELKQ